VELLRNKTLYRLQTAKPWMVGSVSHFAGRLFTPFAVLGVFTTEDLLTDETAEENIILVYNIIFLSSNFVKYEQPIYNVNPCQKIHEVFHQQPLLVQNIFERNVSKYQMV
jgi:hypothetical protein